MIRVTVERPNGTTFTQDVKVKGDNVKKTLTDYKKSLGRGYMLCSWYKIC